jgi:hypothetical protein
LALSLLSGIVIGVAPAITATRRGMKPAFQEGGRGASGGTAARQLRKALVAAELALAIVLLVGAGTAHTQSAERRARESGVQPRARAADSTRQPCFSVHAQRVEYFERARAQASAVAGVERAAIASEFFIGGNPERLITVEGSQRGEPERVRFRSDEITPEFFDTVGTPMVKGRPFTSADGHEWAEGCHHQRGDGQTAVARPGPDRPPFYAGH